MDSAVWAAVAATIGAFAAFVTAGIIYSQASALVQQNQIGVLIQMQGEWESARVRNLRSRWANDPDDLETAERLLEFLEEFAGFRRREILDDELVWDTTLGWHAARYYFYCRGTINVLRERWQDPTLYRNLETELWPSYIQNEIVHRPRASERSISEEFERTKGFFLAGERRVKDEEIS